MRQQEAYAVVATVKNFRELLYCKEFKIESDHRNLCWDKLAMCEALSCAICDNPIEPI